MINIRKERQTTRERYVFSPGHTHNQRVENVDDGGIPLPVF